MSYAIVRTAKLKSMGSIGGSLSHDQRERDTPNADPERTHLNEHQGGTPEQIMQAITDRLPEKRRSDAVLCVEYLITASPDHFDGKQDDGAAYFRDAVDWLKERHGAENVIATTIHRDETTPHLVAYVVPIDPAGKLNAKHFLGGRAKLSEMQTDFAERVGKQHGLERGIEGSRAEHTTIRDYYGRVKQEAIKAPKIDVPDPTVSERLNPKAYGHRVADDVIKQMMPAWREMSAKASERDQAVKDADTAKAAQKAHSERLKPVEDAFRGLSPKGQQQLLYIVQGASERVREAEKREKQQEAERKAQQEAEKRAQAAEKQAQRAQQPQTPQTPQNAPQKPQTPDWGEIARGKLAQLGVKQQDRDLEM